MWSHPYQHYSTILQKNGLKSLICYNYTNTYIIIKLNFPKVANNYYSNKVIIKSSSLPGVLIALETEFFILVHHHYHLLHHLCCVVVLSHIVPNGLFVNNLISLAIMIDFINQTKWYNRKEYAQTLHTMIYIPSSCLYHVSIKYVNY